MRSDPTPQSQWLPVPVRGRTGSGVTYHPGVDSFESGSGPGGRGPDVRRYLEVLRTRWRVVAGTFAVVVAAVALGTALQTRVYRASGLMELRGQTAEGASVEALFQAARLTPQFLGTQYEVLRSPALARRVAADVSRRTADSSAEAIERMANGFPDQLVVDPVVGSNLVRVHFEAADPALAARVVNSVFEQYAGMRTDAARTGALRLASEVDSTRERLTRAERRLQSYARRNGLAFVETGRGASDNLPQERMRLLQEQLTAAEADRYSKEALYNMGRTTGEEREDSEVLRSLNVRLAELRSDYAKLRSTFMEDYPRTKEVKAQVDELEALVARERARLGEETTARYRTAVRRQALLQQAIDEQRALVDKQGEKTTQYRILARDVEAQQALYAKLQEKRRAAEVAVAVAATDVNVIEPAVAPPEPIRPVPSRNMQLAVLVGLMLGVGAAFLREHTDVTVRSVDEIESLAVPVLGIIPSLRLAAAQQSDARARQMVEEAFGSLRTAVVFDDRYQRYAARSLLVTSAQPGDGKTTISSNLALSLARLGMRVLLIDADTRRPAVHRAFGITPDRGLGDALTGDADWSTLVHADVAPGLDVLPTGTPLTGHTELLSSPRMRAVIEEARRRYEFVLVDSPALHINAADTRILAPLVDGVVVVVRSGVTPRTLMGRMLSDVPNVIGVVLNDFDFRHFPAYYHDYGAPAAAVGPGA